MGKRKDLHFGEKTYVEPFPRKNTYKKSAQPRATKTTRVMNPQISENTEKTEGTEAGDVLPHAGLPE